MVTEHELLTALRVRRADPSRRIDTPTAGVPPLFECVPLERILAAESALGFALAPLLHRIYTEVGNGGFGPGAGLLGIEGGHTDLDNRTLSSSYLALRDLGCPRGVLPFCDLGGGARSAVDMRVPGDNILTVDAAGITRTRFDLGSWLYAWAIGTDVEAETFEIKWGTMVNPFTKRLHTIKQRGQAKGVLLESFGS